MAGYLPGILMGLGLMIVAGIIAKRRGYPVAPRPELAEVWIAARDAALPLGLIVIVMGGIISGVFTATEASAAAVLYTLLLALVWYREITLKDLPAILIDSAVTTSRVTSSCSANTSSSRRSNRSPQTAAPVCRSVSRTLTRTRSPARWTAVH